MRAAYLIFENGCSIGLRLDEYGGGNWRQALSGVPSDWHRKTPIAKYEVWYAGMVCAYLIGAGYEVPVEEATNHGRIDLALPLPDIVWIFEFKVAGRGDAKKALQQIIDRDYAGKYRDGRRRIVLVGVEVNEDERNLVGLETAEG